MKFLYLDPVEKKMITVEVKSGMSIGRKKADLVIRDGLISTKHASIEESKDGLMIVDQGSTNKIKHNGEKKSELLLTDGLEFELGNVVVKVIDHDSSMDLTATSTGDDEKTVHWSEQLGKGLKSTLKLAKQGSEKLYPFHFHVNLKIVAGPDEGKNIELLYGPRSIGNLDQDICIYDWSIDQADFQLVQHDGGIYLTTNHPDKVLVNKKESRTRKLNTGDKIYLGLSCLEVSIKDYA